MCRGGVTVTASGVGPASVAAVEWEAYPNSREGRRGFLAIGESLRVAYLGQWPGGTPKNTSRLYAAVWRYAGIHRNCKLEIDEFASADGP